MTTKTVGNKRTTMAQIQSQLEETRAVIDRQRKEIALLKEEIVSLKKPAPQPSNAWGTIKKEWRQIKNDTYYSFVGSNLSLANRAKTELTDLGKQAYVSTFSGGVRLNIKK